MTNNTCIAYDVVYKVLWCVGIRNDKHKWFSLKNINCDSIFQAYWINNNNIT